jgi:anti-sigma regulatory factor (Ser/Thr protein kinase)
MKIKDKIIKFAEKHAQFRVADFVEHQKQVVSRQYVSRIIKELITEKKLVKSGSTASATYALPENADIFGDSVLMLLANEGLEEHKIIEKIENQASFILKLPDNIRSIFDYAFSEMLNNAIEHSKSKNIGIEVKKQQDSLLFEIRDFGVGVFRNIMQKRKLKSELEAMQDLLKGKTTTAPQAHSGEGIFFTSKVADIFTLDSFDYVLTVDNRIGDVFFGKSPKRAKKGTAVTFGISLKSNKHLIDTFQKFQSDDDMAFDKTEIQIKLYTMGTVHISRSQARRVLTGLDKFKTIIMDFDRVPMIGQAFADEVFRVFKNQRPEITIIPKNMNDAVEFMVKRVGSE